MKTVSLIVLSASLATALSGCAVVSVAGAAAGAAISVTGAVVSTGIKVTGKVIEKTIDVVTPTPEQAPAQQDAIVVQFPAAASSPQPADSASAPHTPLITQSE